VPIGAALGGLGVARHSLTATYSGRHRGDCAPTPGEPALAMTLTMRGGGGKSLRLMSPTLLSLPPTPPPLPQLLAARVVEDVARAMWPAILSALDMFKRARRASGRFLLDPTKTAALMLILFFVVAGLVEQAMSVNVGQVAFDGLAHNATGVLGVYGTWPCDRGAFFASLNKRPGGPAAFSRDFERTAWLSYGATLGAAVACFLSYLVAWLTETPVLMQRFTSEQKRAAQDQDRKSAGTYGFGSGAELEQAAHFSGFGSSGLTINRKVRRVTIISGAVLLMTAVAYSLMLGGSSTSVCYVVTGSGTSTVRMLEVMRYVYWMASTPLIVAAMCHNSGLPAERSTQAFMWQVVVVVSGFGATIGRQQPWMFWVCAAVSFGSFAFVSRDLFWAIAASGTSVTKTMIRRSTGEGTGAAAGSSGAEFAQSCKVALTSQRLWASVGSVTIAMPLLASTWLAFPCVWALSEANLLDPRWEILLSPILDVGAKVLFGVFMMLNEAAAMDDIVDLDLCFVEEQRLLADASNDAKRKFVRYVFHELRVPLNAVSLGLDDVAACIGDIGADCSALDEAQNAVVSERDVALRKLAEARSQTQRLRRLLEVGSSRSSASSGSGSGVQHVRTSELRHRGVGRGDGGVAGGSGTSGNGQRSARSRNSQDGSGNEEEPDQPAMGGGKYDLATLRFRPRVADIGATVAILMSNVVSMGKLLDDFLSLEKIEDGKLELEMTQFSPADMARDALRLFTAPSHAKQIRLLLDVHPRVPLLIRGDENKLRQVLCNFLSNALKFSPTGSLVSVRLPVVWAAEPAALDGNGDHTPRDENTPDHLEHGQVREARGNTADGGAGTTLLRSIISSFPFSAGNSGGPGPLQRLLGGMRGIHDSAAHLLTSLNSSSRVGIAAEAAPASLSPPALLHVLETGAGGQPAVQALSGKLGAATQEISSKPDVPAERAAWATISDHDNLSLTSKQLQLLPTFSLSATDTPHSHESDRAVRAEVAEPAHSGVVNFGHLGDARPPSPFSPKTAAPMLPTIHLPTSPFLGATTAVMLSARPTSASP
jgi:hypothetical protein